MEPHLLGSSTPSRSPERLTIAEAPDTSALAGTTLFVDGDATAMAKGRTILLAGTDAAGLPVSEALVVEKVEAVGAVVARSAGRTHEITLAAAPDASADAGIGDRVRQCRTGHAR